DTPTPGVNGQIFGSPALQSSMSISSLLAATRTVGWLASTAIAGSFCLFCEKGVPLLPTDTRTSTGALPRTVAENTSAKMAATGIAESLVILVPPQTHPPASVFRSV